MTIPVRGECAYRALDRTSTHTLTQRLQDLPHGLQTHLFERAAAAYFSDGERMRYGVRYTNERMTLELLREEGQEGMYATVWNGRGRPQTYRLFVPEDGLLLHKGIVVVMDEKKSPILLMPTDGRARTYLSTAKTPEIAGLERLLRTQKANARRPREKRGMYAQSRAESALARQEDLPSHAQDGQYEDLPAIKEETPSIDTLIVTPMKSEREIALERIRKFRDQTPTLPPTARIVNIYERPSNEKRIQVSIESVAAKEKGLPSEEETKDDSGNDS